MIRFEKMLDMFKTFTPVSVIVVFLLLGFQSISPTAFEKAEEMYYNAFTKGDYSEWEKADSIFLSVYLGNHKENSSIQRIQAGIYRISIHQSNSQYVNEKEKQADDLKLIKEIIKNNPNLKNEELDMYVQLEHFKNRVYLYQNNPDALENLKSLVYKYSSVNSVQKTTLASIYETISKYYHSTGNARQSAYYGKKSLGLLDSKWDYKQISIKQWVAGSYFNYDKIDSSLYLMKEAYKQLHEFPNETNRINQKRAELAFNIAMIYQGKIGNYHECEYYYKEAIDWEIRVNGDESPTLIVYYSLLGDNYLNLKDIQQANFYAMKAYSLANDVLQTESVYLKSIASMSLSRIYIHDKNFDAARELMDKVLEESLDFFGKEDKFTTQVYIDRAIIEQESGNFSEAEKYYLLSYEAAKATGRVYSIASSYDSLTDMYLQTKDYQKALHYALLSMELNNEHLDEDYKVKAMGNLQLAKIYLELGELANAKKHLNQAEKTLSTNSNTQMLDTEALSIRNSILFKEYESSADLDLLDDIHLNINKLIDIIIKGKSEYKYQNSKLFYSQSVSEYIESSVKIAAEIYSVKPGNEQLNTLFKLMEVNKSTVLLDGMMDAEIKIEKGVPQDILEKENLLSKQIAELNREISRAENDSMVTKEYLKNILDKRLNLNLEMDKIQNHLQEKYTSYYEAKNLLLSENINYYQSNSLNPNQTFLEYFVGNDKVYRLFITPSDIRFDVLNDLDLIEKETENLTYSLLDRSPIEKSSTELAEFILPEFPEEVNDLIIILDKSLTQIPFEILRYKNGFLLEELNVSYAGSVQLYDVQREMATKQRLSGKWIGFAPDYVQNPLSNNKEEVHKISELTNGKEILGAEATKENFLKEAPNASVLHVAAHSEINTLNPMLSKMYFYKNGEDKNELNASEIYNLELQADLVVLSACSTGIGKTESGDGVMSMARAFTYAGISSAVMSLWKVSDKETSDLMVMFYENLKEGQNKNEALRNAKLNYLKQVKEPELQHPYYWAGFVITGDVSSVPEKSNWWLYGLGGLLIVGLSFWVWKIKASRATP